MTTRVRSVAQAFAILRLLALSGPQTLTDVVRALGLSPASCLNLLRTLVDEGVLEREGRRKVYRLAPGWAEADVLGTGKTERVIARIGPLMSRLAKESSATVGLWQVSPGRRVRLVAHAESEALLRIRLGDGQRQPLGGGAVGRALAAAQAIDDGELARRFAEVKWQQPMPLRQYINEVRMAQENGYAVDDNASFAGVCTVAVAMPDLHPGFCVSASLFSGSRSSADVARIGIALLDFKHEITRPDGSFSANSTD